MSTPPVVVPDVPELSPQRRCYSCGLPSHELHLEKCDACNEHLCSRSYCPGLCRCDLVKRTAELFPQNVDHIKILSGKDSYMVVKDSKLRFVAASEVCHKWWGPIVGKSSVKLFGYSIGLELESVDEQVLLTGQPHEWIHRLPIGDDVGYILTRKFRIRNLEGQFMVVSRSTVITDLVVSSEENPLN